jgi:hypothetical protein
MFWIGISSLWAWCAQAQVPYFDGLSAQIATGYQRQSPLFFDYKSSGTANGLSTETGTTQGAPLVVSLTYTWPVNHYASIGLAYERNLLRTSAARQDLYTSGTWTSGGTIRFKNQNQLSIVPGVLMDPSSMLYAKLGLAYATSDASNDNGSAAQNFEFSGWGYGVGVKGFVSPHQFAFAEYNRIHMSDTLRSSGTATDTFQTSSKGSVLLLGMGWQF